MASQVKSVQFGLLSDDDIVGMSACVVDRTSLVIEHGSVYDPRMGCVQNGVECETCGRDIWTCTGHFGHIELAIPVILFYKQCVHMLRCFCLSCSRILTTDRELKLNNVRDHDSIVKFLSNDVSSCPHCEAPVPDIKLQIAESIITASHKSKQQSVSRELTPAIIKAVFDIVTDCDVALLGVDAKMMHPRCLVLTKFPVIPTCCRPKMTMGDTTSDDDLTLMLIDILKANAVVKLGGVDGEQSKQRKKSADPDALAKAVACIKIKTLAYTDNSRGKAIHNTNHKPMVGIKERINRKTGIVRQNLTGKRCDRTARTVIGPDPTLKLDEVAIAEEIANTLTIPEFVNPLNIDRLTTIVNTGRATKITRSASGTTVNVAAARVKRGTQLNHGDIVIRDGRDIAVMNCKMQLFPEDQVRIGEVTARITRNPVGTTTFAEPPSVKHINLEIGDKVERFLQDGDPVYLNRQPTLHRNSMLGMRVKVKPGRTTRFNLSITKGLNADFDGDEGNIFVCETLESAAELKYVVGVKEHMLSAQTNKPEQVIVQDSLLGAYLMTKERRQMSRADIMNCLMHIDRAAQYDATLGTTSADLFSYILPRDFDASYPNLRIEGGRVVSGFFDKASLGSSQNAIVRLLAMEYGKEIAASFIDNVQFLTNVWLEIFPFSIGIHDCLADRTIMTEIRDVASKFFLEADTVAKTTNDKLVREAKINMSLNKAKDIGMRIAKDALKSDNNIAKTVTSGSKGDWFNIAQITGLLGQQNLNNHRPVPELTNNTRTMIHYPPVIADTARKYESRGFVSSSFVGGLNPREMWFHAMTGREGMISTALKTARSGYIQRSCVKLNEDLKVQYDGTVRDTHGSIYQFAYGNNGFDPSRVTFMKDGQATPIDFDRLAKRLACGTATANLVSLSDDEIENVVGKACRRFGKVDAATDSVWAKNEQYLRQQLQSVRLPRGKIAQFSEIVIEKYHTARAVPGECVGIISAQSIGQVQTQDNLNTFHTAGKLTASGIDRFEEIVNMTKTIKFPTMNIYFVDKFATAQLLREAIGCSIVGLTFGDIVCKTEMIESDTTLFHLKKSVIFANRLSLGLVCDALEAVHEGIECECKSVLAIAIKTDPDVKMTDLLCTRVCGIEGISAMFVEKDDSDEFFIRTSGSNLRKMLGHPLVDVSRLYTNSVQETFDCLGIAAARRMMLRDLKQSSGTVNDCHVRLLVDRMTFKGRPVSISRYTLKAADAGCLSKASFEQSVDIILAAAFKSETDNLAGVSSAVICGNQARVGTGVIDVLIDWGKYSPTEMLQHVDQEVYY